MNKSKKLLLAGLALSMYPIHAQEIPDLGPIKKVRTTSPDPVRKQSSNRPTKKRAKVKLARKQKHRK